MACSPGWGEEEEGEDSGGERVVIVGAMLARFFRVDGDVVLELISVLLWFVRFRLQ